MWYGMEYDKLCMQPLDLLPRYTTSDYQSFNIKLRTEIWKISGFDKTEFKDII